MNRSLLMPALAALFLAAGPNAVADSAAPSIGFVSPGSVPAGSGAFTLIVSGFNFQSGAQVTWNHSPLAVTSFSANQLTAAVPAAFTFSAGPVDIQVTNPGGAASNIVTFQVTAPLVTISPAVLPPASLGIVYSVTLTANGGTPPYAWSALTPLPPGLLLNPNGSITGIPTAPGTVSFTIGVTDSANSTAVKTYTVTVSSPGFTISTTTPLPSGTVNQYYRQTLAAAGGIAPYRWAAGPGIPGGITLTTDGLLSGTPLASGTFTFIVQVSDATNSIAAQNFTVTIAPAPLSITTVSPLFTGTVAVAYAQTFTAAGGLAPYTWSITAGNTGDLKLDASTGVLQGTPKTAGTLTFTVQVADSAGTKATAGFSLTVSQPALNITTPSILPSGQVGALYSLTFTVSGGTAPYTWTLSSGTVPGLTFDGDRGMLTDTPSTPGVFNFALQVKDASGLSAGKSFSITVNPAALHITSNLQLPDGAITSSFSQQLQAAGGVTPYTWSANGLPDGLTLDANTGMLTGTPTVAGNFSFTVRVTDSARVTALELFHLLIALPALPAVRITGLQPVSAPASQFTLKIAMGSSFPTAVTGQAVLSFAPDSGPGDSTIQFAAGGRSATFSIPQGTTDAVFSVPLAVQTGTVAGTLTVSLSLQAAGLDVTPSTAPTVTSHIDRAAPVITSAKVVRKTGGFDIVVTGYSTAREVTQADFNFSAAAGQTLAAGKVTVPLESMFSTWFQDPANTRYGSQFVFTQPFTTTGDSTAVTPDSVTFTNRLGSVTAPITP